MEMKRQVVPVTLREGKFETRAEKSVSVRLADDSRTRNDDRVVFKFHNEQSALRNAFGFAACSRSRMRVQRRITTRPQPQP